MVAPGEFNFAATIVERKARQAQQLALPAGLLLPQHQAEQLPTGGGAVQRCGEAAVAAELAPNSS